MVQQDSTSMQNAETTPDEPVGAPLTAGTLPQIADVHRPGHEPGGGADEGPVHMAVPAEKKGRKS